MTESNGRSDETKLATIEPGTMERHLSHTEQQQLAARPLRDASPHNGDDYLDLKKRRKQRRRRCGACCVVTLVVLVIIIVVLALTVFKTKKPKIYVSSVTLKGLSTALDPTTLKLHLNVTVVTVMSLKNPNKVGSFKFGNSTASISYQGSAIGLAVIPAGKIKADKTVSMTVPVTIYTDVLLSKSNLLTDGISGSLPITVSTKLSGKLNLLHIIKKHVTIRSVCEVVVGFSKNTVTADIQKCSNSVKI